MKTLLSYGTGKIFATGLLPMASLPIFSLQSVARNDNDLWSLLPVTIGHAGPHGKKYEIT